MEQPEALRLANEIECWRLNYCLDQSPHALAELWKGGAPFGAVLALKASTDELRRQHAEIERLRAAMERISDAWSDAVQSDFENGIAFLSAAAAKKFRETYPEISAMGRIINDEYIACVEQQ